MSEGGEKSRDVKKHGGDPVLRVGLRVVLAVDWKVKQEDMGR